MMIETWEYLLVTDNAIEWFEDKLNTLGKEGWELVTVTETHAYTAFLKRPSTRCEVCGGRIHAGCCTGEN